MGLVEQLYIVFKHTDIRDVTITEYLEKEYGLHPAKGLINPGMIDKYINQQYIFRQRTQIIQISPLLISFGFSLNSTGAKPV